MKEEQLFEAIGQIESKHVTAAQRRRGRADARERKEYVAAPEKDGGFRRWLIPVACALMAAVLVTVIPRFYKGGAEPLLSIAVSDTTGETLQNEPEPTGVPPIIEPAPYIMVFGSVEDYWRLRETVDLPDEDLKTFLWENHYSQGDSGIGTREQLMKFIEDTQYLPIPSQQGDALQRISIVEYEDVAVFEFSGFTMEITKEPNKERTQWETSSLSRIWDYEAYPLYMGAETISGGVVYLTLVMKAEDYLVTISAETDDPKRFVDSLEGLTFQFPEIASVTPPVGVYSGELYYVKWEFVEQTGTLTLSCLRGEPSCAGFLIPEEAPWYPYAEKITSLVVEEGIVGIEANCIVELPNLQKVSLPQSLESIDQNNFSGCAIQELWIPAAVTDIGMGVAADCANLRTVTVEAWQPQIGQQFLQNCPALEKITMKSPTGYWQQVVLNCSPSSRQ